MVVPEVTGQGICMTLCPVYCTSEEELWRILLCLFYILIYIILQGSLCLFNCHLFLTITRWEISGAHAVLHTPSFQENSEFIR